VKPRLRFKGGVWSCASLMALGSNYWRIGYGYTVHDAWDDWQKQSGIYPKESA
jgi:hypothetical protein